eukprot:COSAG01_NODE_1875_length_8997_cov_11.927624_8_plen_202_part_00
MVCTGQLGPAVANASSCACSGWDYLRLPCDPAATRGCNVSNHGHDRAQWYCETGPGWKPGRQDIENSQARHDAAAAAVAAAAATFVSRTKPAFGLGWVPQRNPFLSIWQPAPLKAGTAPHTVSVDMRALNGTAAGVFAIRYAWPFSGDSCCPSQLVRKGLEICRPAACPILSASTNLPMNGFFARIVGNKCQCLPPQTCDA